MLMMKTICPEGCRASESWIGGGRGGFADGPASFPFLLDQEFFYSTIPLLFLAYALAWGLQGVGGFYGVVVRPGQGIDPLNNQIVIIVIHFTPCNGLSGRHRKERSRCFVRGLGGVRFGCLVIPLVVDVVGTDCSFASRTADIDR